MQHLTETINSSGNTGQEEDYDSFYSTFRVLVKLLTLETECHCWTALWHAAYHKASTISPHLGLPPFGHQAPDWAAKNALLG